jgi:hypothetical protein
MIAERYFDGEPLKVACVSVCFGTPFRDSRRSGAYRTPPIDAFQ